MFLLKKSLWQPAIVSGLLVGISYLPLNSGFLIYFGFIPIFHSWIKSNSKSNFKSGLIFGITYNLISNYWIGTNSGAELYVVFLSLIFAVFYLGLFWAFAGYIYGRIKTSSNAYIILPLLVVSLEWIRSFGPLGFTLGKYCSYSIRIYLYSTISRFHRLIFCYIYNYFIEYISLSFFDEGKVFSQKISSIHTIDFCYSFTRFLQA